MRIADFKKKIWKYYREHGRDFPWRPPALKFWKDMGLDAYKIVVSEIMLQQTQTFRVEPKYLSFVKKFPNFKSLAVAPASEVLKYWHGLGYNRRALYIKKIAETVIRDHKGTLPDTQEELITLPGIGKNTAGSILAFAFNKPVPFIETNIRRVFIHFFFENKKSVHDDEILKLVAVSLDKKKPREWYYALMDYGVYLAKVVKNPNRRSKHYVIQSKFEGSDRQARGLILKILIKSPAKMTTLVRETGRDSKSLQKTLGDLQKEGFIVQKRGAWQLKS